MAMNKKEQLLQQILCGDGALDPVSASAILTSLRRQKRIQKIRRTSAGIVAGLCGLILTQHLLSLEKTTPIELTASTQSQSSNVELINDHQLLNLLSDQPSALVLLPNGDRRLILVYSSHQL